MTITVEEEILSKIPDENWKMEYIRLLRKGVRFDFYRDDEYWDDTIVSPAFSSSRKRYRIRTGQEEKLESLGLVSLPASSKQERICKKIRQMYARRKEQGYAF